MNARLLASALWLTATPAVAQDAAAPAPAASTDEAPLCTDRPTKANAACTVPQGVFQVETDVLNWTRNRDGGVKTDVIYYTNPYFKYGLGDHTDLEVNIAPYVTARTEVAGVHDTIGGVGDLYVRLKQGISPSDSKVQVALIPFVKAPTAKLGIGNNRWEGGLTVPVVFSLPQGFTLNFGPEIDAIADSDGHGKHAQLVGAVNLAKSIGKVTLIGELWTAQNYDPAGTVRQYSADTAIAYLITPKWQIDLGGNFGLNRFTPDAQIYAGVSTKF